MNPNKALWEKGDFTRIAASMRESGEAVVAGLGITAGLKVKPAVRQALFLRASLPGFDKISRDIDAEDVGAQPGRRELDSKRSDTRGADSENQLLLLAATARGLCQPYDVGDRGQRDRAI